MLSAADKNPDLGFNTIYDTMEGLYLGASDTLTNTLRWLIIYLADHSDLVNELLEEIENSIEKNGRASQEDCHLVNSVLLENFRMHPVGDSLPHFALEDVEVAGITIPKGTMVQVRW